MSTHEFEILSMPMEIDKEIFHIVRWMNSLPGVRTLYCCQGNSLKELQSKFGMGRMEAEFWYEHPDFFAHVLFRCCSYSSLKKIQQACPSHEVIFCPIDIFCSKSIGDSVERIKRSCEMLFLSFAIASLVLVNEVGIAIVFCGLIKVLPFFNIVTFVTSKNSPNSSLASI